MRGFIADASRYSVAAGAAWAFLVPATAALGQSSPSPQFPKRGWAGTLASPITGNEMNPNWYYTWGRTPRAGAFGEFIPMAWSGSAVTNPTAFAELTSQSSEYILGFNEPERANQANMTVAQAISLWPQLMASGKKLVSPAVSDDAAGRAWIAEFMSEATRLNLRVDAIAMHWYGDVRPTNAYTAFLSRVDHFHNTYTLNGDKLPIWVTEFGGIDWTGGVDPVTREDNRRFLAGALPGLDSRAHVHRYAWFQWNYPEVALGEGTPFTPTPGGDLYNGRTYATGQTVTLTGDEGTDTFYMRGGTIQGAGSLKTIRSIDFIEGSSRVQGALGSDLEVRNGWVRVRAGATLAKWQANSLTLAGVNVYNDGAISGKQGFIVLSDGASVEGSGYIRTEWNADTTPEGLTLTETAPGLGGVTINNRVWLNGGQFSIPAGSHALNGELTISSNTSAGINGNLTVSGQMTGPGHFTKNGTGVLRLNSPSVNTGSVAVFGGTLVVANATGSAHGAGTLTIGANATLSGDGALGGTGVVVNGTVSPSATSSSARALRFDSPLTLGATSRSIIDIGPGPIDSIESTSTVSVDGTLELRRIGSPANLVPITIVSGSSLTGTFTGVEGFQLPFLPSRTLAVTYTSNSVVVTPTLTGDATLDGIINISDFSVLAANFNAPGRWATGDFNYDGMVTIGDFSSLAANFNLSLQPGAIPLAAAMPEPTAVAVSALFAWGLLARRRNSPRHLVVDSACVAVMRRSRGAEGRSLVQDRHQ